jgi:UDP:flavonoid glycosyltransferase YjiC (YdhE family)
VRLLFMPYPSTSGTWGSVVYLLAIARAARERGHEVVFHACPPSSRVIAADGYTVHSFDGAVGTGTTGPIHDIYDVFTVLGMDRPSYWRYLLDREREVIDDVRPDVLITHMRPTAVVSARRAGVPSVALASAGTHRSQQRRHTGHPLDRLARATAAGELGRAVAGLPELIVPLADAKVAPTFAAFEPELGDVPGLGYVGHLTGGNRSDLAALPPRPERLVLAYLSTVGWSSETMVRSLARSAELAGVHLWCVTNANGRAAEVSDRLRVFDFLPLDELLPEAAGVLFHGGQGTAMASLFHAVPAVAVPGQNYERRYNADRLRSLGCGLHASVLDLRPRALSGLLARIVEDQGMRDAAGEARAALRRLPGCAGAMDIIEGVRRSAATQA